MNRIIRLLAVILLLSVNSASNAQGKKDKKVKKTTIRIVTEENGRKTVIDTTFENADQADINAFLEKQDFDNRPVPPAPPSPPSPPLPPTAAGRPPLPPLPPQPDDEDSQSFNYHFEMPDSDSSFDFDIDINDEMHEVREALVHAKEEMRKSLEDSQYSLDEMEKMINEKVKKQVEIELKKLKMDDDKNSKHRKHIIIKKKTSDFNDDGDDSKTGFFEINKQPHFITSFSTISENSGPIVWNSNSINKRCPGEMNIKTCFIEKKEKHQKFKHFLKRVTDKILD